MCEQRLLTPGEVATWLGVPIATLYAQRYRGDLPGSLGLRVGRHLRFDRFDLEAWIDSQKLVDSTTWRSGRV